MPARTTRRTVLLTAGAAALTPGCGSDGGDGDEGGSSPGAGTAGQELIASSDVPVGGGTVLKDERVVVTQPLEGVFKAFSAICTHQNCLVAEVADRTINCPCHGSRFGISDGAVEQGPATRPLPGKRITVEGNSIRLA
ncbi:Rieske (2Fe-2S) protein [Streptomyces sp. NPDC086080]|uniref:Rieske (2Fe-2S) protein n=1 Tax=Streptomyces sp. NPDC086080 TaxID=3365748 RepID=UPI0037D0F6DE